MSMGIESVALFDLDQYYDVSNNGWFVYNRRAQKPSKNVLHCSSAPLKSLATAVRSNASVLSLRQCISIIFSVVESKHVFIVRNAEKNLSAIVIDIVIIR